MIPLMSTTFVPEDRRQSAAEIWLRTCSRTIRVSVALIGGSLLFVISHSKLFAAVFVVAILGFRFLPKLSGNVNSTKLLLQKQDSQLKSWETRLSSTGNRGKPVDDNPT
jgi:hypothetical protein